MSKHAASKILRFEVATSLFTEIQRLVWGSAKKNSLQCTRTFWVISSTNKNTSHLTVLLSHYFST